MNTESNVTTVPTIRESWDTLHEDDRETTLVGRAEGAAESFILYYEVMPSNDRYILITMPGGTPSTSSRRSSIPGC